jgi:hypothetical protein
MRVRQSDLLKTGILVVLLGAAFSAGCKNREFTTSGSQSHSLKDFDRIEIKPLTSSVPPGTEIPEDVRQRLPAFASGFPSELRPRIYRRHILDASTGRLLVLECVITKYDVVDQQQSITPGESNPAGATVELEVILKDDAGARIGGGKASGTGYGETRSRAMDNAEKKVATAIAEHLRKSIRGSEKGPADSPEEK